MRLTRIRIDRPPPRLTAVLCITALITILIQPAQSSQRAGRQVPGNSNPLVNPGEFPPDFELPILTFKTEADGKSVGVISHDQTIRLSSFRGKKPVCMIMSSYT